VTRERTGPATIIFQAGPPSFLAETAHLHEGVITATGVFRDRRERLSRTWPMTEVRRVDWGDDESERGAA
jgi:hypothetical protein